MTEITTASGRENPWPDTPALIVREVTVSGRGTHVLIERGGVPLFRGWLHPEPPAPAGATVTVEAVEAAWASWFPGTSGPWSTNFRWRLYKALADLGLTVTDTPTEGGAR